MYACMCVCTYVCIYIYVCVSMHVRMYVCKHVCMYVKFVNGFKVIGLTTSKAKAIAKYVSASAQIGSYLCWSSRMCK